jgi:hypothetical protein
MALPTSNSSHIVLQFSTSAPTSFLPFREGWENRYSKVIRILGHTYFSHVDFVTEDGGMLGASDNPQAPIIAGNSRGVAIRVPDYQSFGIRRRMILKTPQAPVILAFARSQIGRPFDASALSPKVFLSDPFVGSVESRDWRNTNKWFCAEYSVWCFEEGDYWGTGVRCPIIKNRITPADEYMVFMMDPNFINRDSFFDPMQDLKMGAYEF